MVLYLIFSKLFYNIFVIYLDSQLYSTTIGIDSNTFTTSFHEAQANTNQRQQESDENKSGGDVKVELLDFAGQIEYYPILQAFLSSSYSAYVIVNSLYRYDKDTKAFVQNSFDNAIYWMSFMSCLFSPRARIPCVIALTHNDHCKESTEPKCDLVMQQSSRLQTPAGCEGSDLCWSWRF